MTRLYSFIFVIEYQTHEKPIFPDFQNVSHTCLFYTGTVYNDTICGVILCNVPLHVEQP